LAKLEAPGARQPKPIPEAIEAFHTSVGNLALATRTKYQRVLRFFSTVGPPPLALPILPLIVLFSVSPVWARACRDHWWYGLFSPGIAAVPTTALLQRYAEVFGGRKRFPVPIW
jgi:hypothetical protein